jgi:hypothetical protein
MCLQKQSGRADRCLPALCILAMSRRRMFDVTPPSLIVNPRRWIRELQAIS